MEHVVCDQKLRGVTKIFLPWCLETISTKVTLKTH